ncbi:hypothetical protein CTM59_08245 [Prevotella intermedia]|uniref:T6SS Phospholipase effector Tle1-like catalytic domain-containing protein n=2 Tax=Prevotella intermedia TaxID=28131 RepID=A0A2M8TJN5_PREIN|nr:hypothetical protein CTM59_08245 [Prevotella intermedia]
MKNSYTNSICGVGLPNKSSSNRNQVKSIDITIGVFFDGTGNNKYNIYFNQKVKDKYKIDSDSYKGSYTNVALLWDMYHKSNTYTDKVYIEGPGTAPPKRGSQFSDEEGLASSGKKDSTLGKAFGKSYLGATSWGVNSKLNRAYETIANKVIYIHKKLKNKKIKSITFDVFGFSRGATGSRMFIKSILEEKDSTLRTSLCKQIGTATAEGIVFYVRFLGLFDTVSSVGLSQVVWDREQHSHLFIPNGVQKVVHLIAANEYRRYFPLTTVTSAHHLGKRCMEYVLPGAHSDIGGGYAEIETEPLYMKGDYPPRKDFEDKNSRNFRGYMSLAGLRNGKWISDIDFQKALKMYGKGKYKKNESAPYRRVYNEYARISLQIMYQCAVTNGLALKTTQDANKSLLISSCYKNLIDVATFLKTEFFAQREIYRINMGKEKMGIDFVRDTNVDKLLKSVRRDFLHLSAYNETGFGATSNNRRVIIKG